MIDVKDRIPGTGMANRKKITPEGGQAFYARVEFADDPAVEGTGINRALFNDLQGFANQTTTFAADGTITETDPVNGVVQTTVFGSNGTITQTRTCGEVSLVKTTTFAADGSIVETVS